LNDKLSGELQTRIDDLRVVVSAGIQTGIPLPAFAASLAYYDGYRSAWLPANLIQAQRDFFGSHQYERTDRKGTFHTEWEKEQADGHS
jgi:6-phosphogluconate dehydrogenase